MPTPKNTGAEGQIESFEPKKLPAIYYLDDINMLLPLSQEEQLQADIDELEEEIVPLTEKINQEESQIRKDLAKAEILMQSPKFLQHLKKKGKELGFEKRAVRLAERKRELILKSKLASFRLENMDRTTPEAHRLQRKIEKYKAEETKNEIAIKDLKQDKANYFTLFAPAYDTLLQAEAFLQYYKEMNQRGFKFPDVVTQQVAAFKKAVPVEKTKHRLYRGSNLKPGYFDKKKKEHKKKYDNFKTLQLKRSELMKRLAVKEAQLASLQQGKGQRTATSSPTQSSSTPRQPVRRQGY